MEPVGEKDAAVRGGEAVVLPFGQIAFIIEPRIHGITQVDLDLSAEPTVDRRCVGKITRRNFVHQVTKTLAGGIRHKVNFYIYYEIDDDEVKHVLLNDWYDGEEEGSWVLLEADTEAAEPAEAEAAA